MIQDIGLENITETLEEYTSIFGDAFLARKGDTVTKSIEGCNMRRTHIINYRCQIEFLNALFKCFDQKPIVFDIGANIGTMAVPLSRLAEKLYIFEPQPDNVSLLHHNLKANGCNQYSICPFGLSDRKLETLIHVIDNNNGASRIQLEGTESQQGLEKNRAIPISLVSGDDYVLENKIQHLDFIKLDVEGHESEVMVGLTETIRKHQPVILMEWNNDLTRGGFAKEKLFSTLLNRYQIYALQVPKLICKRRGKQHGKLMKFIHRKIYSLLTQRVYLMPFDPQNDYEHIFLIPQRLREKFDEITKSFRPYRFSRILLG